MDHDLGAVNERDQVGRARHRASGLGPRASGLGPRASGLGPRRGCRRLHRDPIRRTSPLEEPICPRPCPQRLDAWRSCGETLIVVAEDVVIAAMGDDRVTIELDLEASSQV
jgi:hypothetical protein